MGQGYWQKCLHLKSASNQLRLLFMYSGYCKENILSHKKLISCQFLNLFNLQQYILITHSLITTSYCTKKIPHQQGKPPNFFTAFCEKSYTVTSFLLLCIPWMSVSTALNGMVNNYSNVQALLIHKKWLGTIYKDLWTELIWRTGSSLHL